MILRGGLFFCSLILHLSYLKSASRLAAGLVKIQEVKGNA